MEQAYLFDNSIDPETGKPKHLHTLNGKPLTGTSAVMEIVAKPLTWWASGEAVKTLGWTPKTEYVKGKPRTLPKEPRIQAAQDKWDEIAAVLNDPHNNEGRGEVWLGMLDTAYGAHASSLRKSAGKGKDLHSELEKYVKFSIEKNEGNPANVKSEDIQEFIDWSCENVDKFLWSEMHTYSEEHWLGGITDAGALLRNGKTAIIDFKSSKAAYPTQFWQIAGYDIQIQENGGFTSKGAKIMEPVKIDAHIVIPFGAPKFDPAITYDEKDLNKTAFLAALTLYRANQAIE